MMLGWLAGSNNEEYTGFTDDAKQIDAPETPAPVFAYRAFKNAMFGTPGVVEDEDKDLTNPIRPLNPGARRRTSVSQKTALKPSTARIENSEPPKLAPEPQEPAQPVPSPTKSILLTPGIATTTRRKTVSFGEGVVDNERKRSPLDDRPDIEPVLGNISRQWASKTSEGSGRNKSKFTQSLIEAREQKIRQEAPSISADLNEKHSGEKVDALSKDVENDEESDISQEEVEDAEDETINLEMPHSQSGKFWKSEFESYRMKTEKEIKKLIEYRSAARSYAKKKDTEASRLTGKLKQEEAKVADMERRVSELAAGMVGGATTGNSNKEQMVRELSLQTAAALQYKQKAASLRKTLEQHGVVDDNDKHHQELSADETAQKLREVEDALREANAQLRVADGNTKVNELIPNLERKAAELEKENQALKRSLARFKEEMSKYESRRKAKEAKLKQREQKLECRVQEYSSRLKASSKARRESEEALMQSFANEKKLMQDRIDFLTNTLRSTGQLASRGNPHTKHHRGAQNEHNALMKENASHTYRLEDDNIKDQNSLLVEISNGEKKESDMTRKHGEPNYRLSHGDIIEGDAVDKARFMTKPQRNSATALDVRAPKSSNKPLIHLEEPLINFEDSLRESNSHHRRNNDLDYLAPQTADSQRDQRLEPHKKAVAKHRTSYRAFDSHRPSVLYLSPPGRVDLSIHQRRLKPRAVSGSNSRRQRVTVNSSSDLNRQATLGLDSPVLAKLESMPADRVAAAKVRLKQRDMIAKRSKIEGKENMVTA